MGNGVGTVQASNDRLIRLVAEQLKVPLVHIASTAEMHREVHESLLQIENTAETALRLVESFLLATEQRQQVMEFEPVAVGAVLYDVAHQLQPLAQEYGLGLEVSVKGSLAPIMTQRKVLERALYDLGLDLLQGAALVQTRKKQKLLLGAHRAGNRVVSGVYAPGFAWTNSGWRRSIKLITKNNKPLASTLGQVGAGCFVAQLLLESLEATLALSKHHNLVGLGATLPTSAQLGLL